MEGARKDPAEEGYLRHFYRGWRPTRLGKIHNRVFAFISGLGLTPKILVTLKVKDRSNGRYYSTILAATNYQGNCYLVSMLGDGSNWVQDARAGQGHAFIKRWLLRPILLIEIPAKDRAPILKAWCEVATSGRRHLPVSCDAPVSAFDAIAADYPVFRIDSAENENADGCKHRWNAII